METTREQIRRSALERYGLVPDSTDYNLDRIVRMVAFAFDCKYASFSVMEGPTPICLAAHGAAVEQFNGGSAMCDSVFRTAKALFVRDLAAEAEWSSDPWASGPLRMRSYAGVPVFASAMIPIGTLSVMDESRKILDTPPNRRALNDFVRLIEDSLMMRSAAIRDPMTGLYNRRFFLEQIRSEWHRAMRLDAPISMLALDIDHFKLYNDTAGHPAGDRVIVEVGRTLESRVRRAGDTVCRFGGEEFMMILPATDAFDAALVAESIRAAVEAAAIPHPGHPGRRGSPVTVSIGMATVNARPEMADISPRDLVKLADDALYEAKLSGRNCVRPTIQRPRVAADIEVREPMIDFYLPRMAS